MLIALRHNLLSIIIFSYILVSISFAVPIQQQEFKTPTLISSIKKVPSTIYSENYNVLITLDEYYSTIATQVLDSTINEIIETASETFLTIHQLQIFGREYCRTSLTGFMKVLKHELDQVKYTLLTSIKPLIKKNYDQRSNIIELNTIISEQLGLLLNPNQVADNTMKQIYQDVDTFFNIWKSMTNNKWAETIHHERNESIALKAWLNSWLLDIEFTLKEMFDSQISALF